jgi:hypothetical protein
VGLSTNADGMLTVLIETRDDEAALAQTLGSLVPGAVQGMVREVIVCDRGSADGMREVAEHAGCVWLAEGGVAEGIRQAKAEWLLLLEPGARLAEGWIEDVALHMARSAMPARFSRARGSRAGFLSRVFSRQQALAEGLLIGKRQAATLVKHAGSAEGIARGLAAKRLKAEIWPAGKDG